MKGRLTQFKKYLDAVSDSPSQLKIKEIKYRMQAATEQFKTFNEIESQIELISASESEMEYVESFESLYFHIMALAETKIEVEETGSTSNSNNHSSRFGTKCKLPDIKLPSFDGSFDGWLEYKNSYETMIHQRSDLDEIQKFHYLRSSLGGSALQVISALEFTADNYKHAWELLEHRFHNTRLLVHNHLKSLFTIPSLKQESHFQIRKLIDTVLRNLRALKTLDEPTDSWDTILIYLIVMKLDTSTERDWEKYIGSILSDYKRRLKLEDLLSFLRNKADMLDMINASYNKSQNKSTTVTNESKSSHYKNNTQVHSYVSTSNNVSKNKRSNNDKKCILICPCCNENHALYMCCIFLNMLIQDRIKFVQDKKLCHNCLRTGHLFKNCLYSPCKLCQSKHNTLLHVTRSFNTSKGYRCVSEERTADHSDINASGSPSAAMHSLSIDTYRTVRSADNNTTRQNTSQPVLLCTALVDIVDQDNRVHTLLDNGSQHCFMLNNLRKRIYA